MGDWVNNNGVLSQGINISQQNRAWAYGDGFFETMLFENGKCVLFKGHYGRLIDSAQFFGLEGIDKLIDTLPDEIFMVLNANDLTTRSARVKIQVYREDGGTYLPSGNKASFLITAAAWDDNSGGSHTTTLKIGIAESVTLFSKQRWTRFKSMSGMAYVLAAREQQRRGLDELVLLNENAVVTEGVSSNIWWVRNEVVNTPSLSSGCVAGVFRAHLLEKLEKEGVRVEEVLTGPDILMNADEIFYTNALRGIVGVEELKGNYFKSSFTHYLIEVSRQ